MLESLKTELAALLNGLARLREDFTRRFPLKNCMFRGLRNRLTVKILMRFFIFFNIFLMNFSCFTWFYVVSYGFSSPKGFKGALLPGRWLLGAAAGRSGPGACAAIARGFGGAGRRFEDWKS